jgi:hypothetical protein
MLLNFCFRNFKSKTNFKNLFSKYNTNNCVNNVLFKFISFKFSNNVDANANANADKPKYTGKNFVENKKSMKTDPHNFDIYGKIKPNFGKPAEPQPFPDYIHKLPPVDPDEKYHFYDIPDSIKFAIKNNYPIEREPVSAYYSSHVNGKTYHVFNAARIVSSSLNK